MPWKLINLVFLVTTMTFHSQSESKISKSSSKYYEYNVNMRRTYLDMKFNEFVIVNGDPTDKDISVVWMKNITESVDMEIVYMILNPAKNYKEITSKFLKAPLLCNNQQSLTSWDENIRNIYLKGVTNATECPIPSGKLTPPHSFKMKMHFKHKISCGKLRFVMDLYPHEEMESISLLVLEGDIYSLRDC